MEQLVMVLLFIVFFKSIMDLRKAFFACALNLPLLPSLLDYGAGRRARGARTSSVLMTILVKSA